MKTKPYHFQMAVKAVKESDGGVVIEGFASTPDIDRYRDIVQPDAFKGALEMYMKNPVLLRSHDADRPVGRTLSATVTDKGLRIRGEVMDEKTQSEVLDGRMSTLSIGYIPQQTTLMIEQDDGSLREFNFEEDSIFDPKAVRVIEKLDLVEISIVSTPANGNALFTVAKSVKRALNEIVMKSFNLTPAGDDEEDLNKPNDKSMDIKKKSEGEVPADEEKKDESVEETTEEAVEDEEKEEETTEETTTDEVEEEAAEGTDEESKDATESTESEAEEAGNSDENSEADDAEGEDEEESSEDAEEADADAEPQEDEEDDEESEDEADEEKALVILEAKDAEKLAILKGVGAVRIAEKGEKATELPAQVKELMELADSALSMAQKEIETLEEKLDKYAEKKALAPHSQLDGGDEEKNTQGSEPQVSEAFKGLFPKF